MDAQLVRIGLRIAHGLNKYVVAVQWLQSAGYMNTAEVGIELQNNASKTQPAYQPAGQSSQPERHRDISHHAISIINHQRVYNVAMCLASRIASKHTLYS